MDRVLVQILKSIGKILVDPLVFTYNLSIEQSIFPNNFKLAIIEPLFRNRDKSSTNNYRSILMLSNFSKLLKSD